MYGAPLPGGPPRAAAVTNSRPNASWCRAPQDTHGKRLHGKVDGGGKGESPVAASEVEIEVALVQGRSGEGGGVGGPPPLSSNLQKFFQYRTTVFLGPQITSRPLGLRCPKLQGHLVRFNILDP
jgi:hypothetical protein